MIKQQWYDWVNQEETKAFFAVVKYTADNNTLALASGATLGENTGELTARVVGRIEAYNDMLNYKPEFDDAEEENAD